MTFLGFFYPRGGGGIYVCFIEYYILNRLLEVYIYKRKRL